MSVSLRVDTPRALQFFITLFHLATTESVLIIHPLIIRHVVFFIRRGITFAAENLPRKIHLVTRWIFIPAPLPLALSRRDRPGGEIHAITMRNHEAKRLFQRPDRIDRNDTTAQGKSAATRLQFARMQRAGRAWRLQNLRVKVYAPAENTYLHAPVQAVRCGCPNSKANVSGRTHRCRARAFA